MSSLTFWKWPKVKMYWTPVQTWWARIKIYLDRVFGLRAWGLLLYGLLPANLALIGTLDVKLGKVDNILPYVLPVSLLPIVITYLLIFSRHRTWYLTREFLKRRSLITTLLILLGASLISGTAGILQGRYVLSFRHVWDRPHGIAIAESFLFGVSSLVITSTLFMSLLTKATDLPGIPSPHFVESLAKLRAGLRQVQTSKVWKWNDYRGRDDAIQPLRDVLVTLGGLFTELDSNPGDELAKSSVKLVAENVRLFAEVVATLPTGDRVPLKRQRWIVFFEAPEQLTENQLVNRNQVDQQYQAALQLRSLTLGE